MVPETLEEEISLILTLYEHTVNETIVFPRAGQENLILENLYDEITLAYTVLNQYHPAAIATSKTEYFAVPVSKEKDERSHPNLVAVPTSWELLLESLYRGTFHTFRSRTLHRRIIRISLLLESIDEAAMAIKAFVEKDKCDKQGEWWRRIDQLPPPNAPATPHPISPQQQDSMRSETIGDVLTMFLVGCRLALEMHQVQLAMFYAEKAMELCRSFTHQWGRLLLPVTYYYLGLCFSRLAKESKVIVLIADLTFLLLHSIFCELFFPSLHSKIGLFMAYNGHHFFLQGLSCIFV
jgi:hypothetical protein